MYTKALGNGLFPATDTAASELATAQGEMPVGSPALLFACVLIMIRVTWAKMIRTFPTLGAGFHTLDGSHCRCSRASSLCIQTPIIADAIQPGWLSRVHHAASIPASSTLITRVPGYPPLTSPQGPTSLPQPTRIKFHWLPRMCWKAWIWTFAEGPKPHIKLHIANIPILAVHNISNSEFPKRDSISRLPFHEWIFCSGLCSHRSRKRMKKKKNRDPFPNCYSLSSPEV